MTTIELRQVRNGASGLALVKKVDGQAVLAEQYASYAVAMNRAQWFHRMDWRVRILVIR